MPLVPQAVVRWQRLARSHDDERDPFGLLMAAELAVSVLTFGRSLGDHLATYHTAAGLLGLAGQLVFAAFPLLMGANRRSIPSSSRDGR